MTLSIELPPDLENSLTAQADSLGVPVTDLALRLLWRVTGPMFASEVKTGADLVRYWRENGLIGTRPDIEDSSAHARAIRIQAESGRIHYFDGDAGH